MEENVKKQNQIEQEECVPSLCLEFTVKAAALTVGLSLFTAVLAPYVPEGLKQKINQVANTDLDANHKNLAKQIDKAPENLGKLLNVLVGQEQLSQDQRHQPKKAASDKCKPEKINVAGFEFTPPC